MEETDRNASSRRVTCRRDGQVTPVAVTRRWSESWYNRHDLANRRRQPSTANRQPSTTNRQPSSPTAVSDDNGHDATELPPAVAMGTKNRVSRCLDGSETAKRRQGRQTRRTATQPGRRRRQSITAAVAEQRRMCGKNGASTAPCGNSTGAVACHSGSASQFAGGQW